MKKICVMAMLLIATDLNKTVLNGDYSVSEIGKDLTKISSPYGIVCREKDILVCDLSGNKIVILDMDGNYLGEAGSLGNGPLAGNNREWQLPAPLPPGRAWCWRTNPQATWTKEPPMILWIY